jgi:hypothetical protein
MFLEDTFSDSWAGSFTDTQGQACCGSEGYDEKV